MRYDKCPPPPHHTPVKVSKWKQKENLCAEWLSALVILAGLRSSWGLMRSTLAASEMTSADRVNFGEKPGHERRQSHPTGWGPTWDRMETEKAL